MTESNILGPDLEPPHGGLERLRHEVRRKNKLRLTRPAYWILAGLAAGLVALLVLVWVPMSGGRQQVRQAVAQALKARPETRFKDAAYIEIPSHRHDVRILLLGSLSHPKKPEGKS